MRIVVIFVCSAVLSLQGSFVSAAEKLNQGQISQGAAGATVREPGGKPPVKPTGGLPASAVPLSILECNKLGGKLTTVNACNTKIACHTKDQNGQSHYVCVTSVISD